jgi:hypothetical protein
MSDATEIDWSLGDGLLSLFIIRPATVIINPTRKMGANTISSKEM